MIARPAGVAAVALALSACGHARAVEDRLSALDETVAEARSAGARRCAPRELALAETHEDLARAALARADLHDARDHLTLAEPNARAAVTLSAEGCEDQAAVSEGGR